MKKFLYLKFLFALSSYAVKPNVLSEVSNSAGDRLEGQGACLSNSDKSEASRLNIKPINWEPKLVYNIFEFLYEKGESNPLAILNEASVVSENWRKGYKYFALNYLNFSGENNFYFSNPFVMFIKHGDVPSLEFEFSSAITPAIFNAFEEGKEVAIVANNFVYKEGGPSWQPYRPVCRIVIPSKYHVICLDKSGCIITEEMDKLPWFSVENNIEAGGSHQKFGNYLLTPFETTGKTVEQVKEEVRMIGKLNN